MERTKKKKKNKRTFIHIFITIIIQKQIFDEEIHTYTHGTHKKRKENKIKDYLFTYSLAHI